MTKTLQFGTKRTAAAAIAIAAVCAVLPEIVSANPANVPRHAPLGMMAAWWKAVAKTVTEPRVVCGGNVNHPIQVRVRPLDPVARGQSVRLEVTVTSAIELADAQLRVADAGGAVLQGAAIRSLGALLPGRAATSVIQVGVPATGGRFLVQLAALGRFSRGVVTRGASYNLLPDGPADVGRAVVTADGTRLIEFAGRRVER